MRRRFHAEQPRLIHPDDRVLHLILEFLILEETCDGIGVLEPFGSQYPAACRRRRCEGEHLRLRRLDRFDRFLHHRGLSGAGGTANQYHAIGGFQRVANLVALAVIEVSPLEQMRTASERAACAASTPRKVKHPRFFGKHFPRSGKPPSIALGDHQVVRLSPTIDRLQRYLTHGSLKRFGKELTFRHDRFTFEAMVDGESHGVVRSAHILGNATTPYAVCHTCDRRSLFAG